VVAPGGPVAVEDDLSVSAAFLQNRQVVVCVAVGGRQPLGVALPVSGGHRLVEPVELAEGLFDPHEIGFPADLFQKRKPLSPGLPDGHLGPAHVAFLDQLFEVEAAELLTLEVMAVGVENGLAADELSQFLTAASHGVTSRACFLYD
jgi:hypothetical protein